MINSSECAILVSRYIKKNLKYPVEFVVQSKNLLIKNVSIVLLVVKTPQGPFKLKLKTRHLDQKPSVRLRQHANMLESTMSRLLTMWLSQFSMSDVLTCWLMALQEKLRKHFEANMNACTKFMKNHLTVVKRQFSETTNVMLEEKSEGHLLCLDTMNVCMAINLIHWHK